MPAKVATRRRRRSPRRARAGRRRRLTTAPADRNPRAAADRRLVDSGCHGEHHDHPPRRVARASCPTGSTALDVAVVDRVAASPRRPSPPSSTATETDLTPAAPDGAKVAIVTDDTDGGSPRPAPLDGARDGAGGHAAVPRRQVLDRPGDRERLLLRLRAARRPDVQRRRPRPRSRPRCARSSKADQPFVRSEVSPAEALELFADQPYKREIIERVQAAAGRQPPTSSTPARSPATRSASTATPTSSSTCAAARTCRRPGGSATSSCRRSPARTGAATRRARCCSASTARRGSRSRRSTSTSTASRRPRSATTASWPPSSTCSASRPSSAAGSRCGTRRAPSSAS